MVFNIFIVFWSFLVVGCISEEEDKLLRNKLRIERDKIEEIKKQIKLVKNSSETLSEHLNKVESESTKLEGQFSKANIEYSISSQWVKTKEVEIYDSLFRLENSEIGEIFSEIVKSKIIISLLKDTAIAKILREFDKKLNFSESEVNAVAQKIKEIEDLIESYKTLTVGKKEKIEEIEICSIRIEKERTKLRKLVLIVKILGKEGQNTPEFVKAKEKYKVNSKTLENKLKKKQEAADRIWSMLKDSTIKIKEIKNKFNSLEEDHGNAELAVVDVLSNGSLWKLKEDLKTYLKLLEIYTNHKQTKVNLENKLEFNKNKTSYYIHKYQHYPEKEAKARQELESEKQQIEAKLKQQIIDSYEADIEASIANANLYTSKNKVNFSTFFNKIKERTEDTVVLDKLKTSLDQYVAENVPRQYETIEMSSFILNNTRVKRVTSEYNILMQRMDFYSAELESRDEQLAELKSDKHVLKEDQDKFREFKELQAKLQNSLETEISIVETIGEESENDYLSLYLSIILTVCTLVWMIFEIRAQRNNSIEPKNKVSIS